MTRALIGLWEVSWVGTGAWGGYIALWAVDWARWLLGYMGENFYLFDMAETM